MALQLSERAAGRIATARVPTVQLEPGMDGGWGAHLAPDQPALQIGADVEVLLQEDGLDSIYIATVVAFPKLQGTKRAKLQGGAAAAAVVGNGAEEQIYVRYHDLLASEESEERLCEWVESKQMRWRPPPTPRGFHQLVRVGDKLELHFEDAWWEVSLQAIELGRVQGAPSQQQGDSVGVTGSEGSISIDVSDGEREGGRKVGEGAGESGSEGGRGSGSRERDEGGKAAKAGKVGEGSEDDESSGGTAVCAVDAPSTASAPSAVDGHSDPSIATAAAAAPAPACAPSAASASAAPPSAAAPSAVAPHAASGSEAHFRVASIKYAKTHVVAEAQIRPQWLWAKSGCIWRFEIAQGHGCSDVKGYEPTFKFASGIMRSRSS